MFNYHTFEFTDASVWFRYPCFSTDHIVIITRGTYVVCLITIHLNLLMLLFGLGIPVSPLTILLLLQEPRM